MRVISGEHRGRSLRAPKGTDTRPTTDRVRESLFSAISSLRGGFESAVVLDAFAGSGALGVEALSRGASFACFCERNRAALAALEANTSFLADGSFRIVRGDVLKRAPSAPEPFDLVLLDPPYALGSDSIASLLLALDAAGSLAESAIVSYEHGSSVLAGALHCDGIGLELATSKTFGSTVIDLYRKESA